MKIDPKGRTVLILGHADGDGHLAAEQSRQNLEKAGALDCRVVVDPQLTRNYRFWEQKLPDIDLGEADLVLFVDLMLNPHEPKRSFKALAELAAQERDRHFVVIDHHPVAKLPRPPSNVFLTFTPTIFLCCYGMPSELMVIAAICGRDDRAVQHLITPIYRKRAFGVARAAADIAGLAGEGLLAILRSERWDLIESLADDSDDAHRRVRGIRVASTPPSSALAAARAVAATM